MKSNQSVISLLCFLLFSIVAWPMAAQQRGHQEKVLEALLRTKELPDSTRAKILSDKGWYLKNRDTDSAFYYLNKSLELAQELNLFQEQLQVLNRISSIEIQKGTYTRAFGTIIQLIELAEQLKIPREVGYGYINLAKAFMLSKNYPLAIANATRAKGIFKEEAKSSAIALADLIIAECYFRENQKNNSQIFLNQAIEVFKDGTIPEYMEEAYLLQAELHLSNNNPEEAKKALALSQNFAETNSKSQTIRRNLLTAKVASKEGKISESEGILLGTLPIAESYLSLPYLIQIYEQLADLNVQLTLYEEALFWHRKADSIANKSNSLNTEEWLGNIQNLVLFRAGERENSQLLLQNLRNTRALEQSENRLKLLIIISIGLIITLFLFLMQIWNSKKQNKLLVEVNQAYKEQQEKILKQKHELEQTQTELQIKNESLQAVNNEKDEIMSIVAHDLKSPLANINSLVQLIQYQITNEAEKEAYLATIKKITEDSVQIINDLLTINRLESKTYQKQFQDFPLPELLQNLIKSFEIQANNKEVFLQLEESYQKDGIIYSDPLTLRRILDNLMSNAIKFSPRSTVVTLRVEEFPFYIKIEMSDEGPGISQKEQKNIFQKFSKSSAKPTSGENSTGLGLYISKELTHQLNGELNVQSSKGSGTTFILTIPK